jgi:hypothetical protein
VRRQIDVGQHDLAAQHRAQLACDAEVAEHVAAVRRRVDLEQPVVEEQRALGGGAERRAVVLVEHDDAGVIVAEPELVLGAQHAGRHDALHRLFREREPARQRRADLCPEHLAAGRRNIRCTAHDLRRRAAALDDDVDERQLVGLRVRLLADHLGDHDAGESAAEVRQALDLESAARERASALLDRRLLVEITQLEEPAPEDLHQNCSRKRRSPS